jgi:hypothetical protein
MTGIDMGSLWVTRLRANFPSAALTVDLVIEATAAQVPATNVHTTQTYTDPTYNPCPSGSNAAAVAFGARRRRRLRRASRP